MQCCAWWRTMQEHQASGAWLTVCFLFGMPTPISQGCNPAGRKSNPSITSTTRAECQPYSRGLLH